MEKRLQHVSIPFKREGTGELQAIRPNPQMEEITVSIPFKREGTCERKIISGAFNRVRNWFQFPSNGKARVNLHEHGITVRRVGFNSLQTGRHV